MLSVPSILQPLITIAFWSRIGFFFSYILTSLLVLEVLRLVYTDANKREVEKLLDAYSTARPARPRESSPPLARKRMRIPIDELERPRTPSPAAMPARERAPVDAEAKRVRRASPVAVVLPGAKEVKDVKDVAPTRRLRKRSDTLTSSGSGASRRRREDSPAESKAGSRHASPTPAPRARSKETKGTSRLEKMLRGKA
ncbi:hypothetical protein ACN47E_005700 [Coniothyrium glycines]